MSSANTNRAGNGRPKSFGDRARTDGQPPEEPSGIDSGGPFLTLRAVLAIDKDQLDQLGRLVEEQFAARVRAGIVRGAAEAQADLAAAGVEPGQA